MRARLRSGLLAAALVAVALPGCVREIPAPTDEERERMALSFLLSRLATPEGAVLAGAPVRRRWFLLELDRVEMERSGVLSETLGLLLLYAATAGNRELFDRQFSLLQSQMLSPRGLAYWKLSADLELAANSNAAVDDLRIAHALVLGYERWREEGYLAQAVELAKTLRETVAPDGTLRDALDWRGVDGEAVEEKITLSYLDLSAMQTLARYDPAWGPIRAASERRLSGGQKENGLFWERYEYGPGEYAGERVNAINLALCGLYLARTAPENTRFLEFLRRQLAERRALYAEYDIRTGEPTEHFESTSVYAISALAALAQRDRALAERLIARMKATQNLDPVSPLFGAFCDDEVYSFDNLLAILALREARQSRENGRTEP